MINKKITLNILLMFLLLNADESLAAYPGTREDFSLLPPFCLAQMKPEWSPPGAPKLWQRRIKGFGHLHHFCGGLHSLRLAQNILVTNNEEKQAKIGLLGAVLTNFKYYENNTDPNDKLLPHLYASTAEALFALGRPGEAAGYLAKAIEKNKKFTKAYSMLADYYIKTGNKKSANEILQEGLKHSPKSKILQKELNALSNK
jgi:tetratricopeptide (TPR) repeat protein